MSLPDFTWTDVAICFTFGFMQGLALILTARLWLKLQTTWFGGGIVAASLGNVCILFLYRLAKPYAEPLPYPEKEMVYILAVTCGLMLSFLILSQIWRINYWQAVKSSIVVIAFGLISLVNYFLRYNGFYD